MKRILVLTLGLLVSALAGAATHSRYRIDLRDGTHIFSVDLPVRHGSVVTFHKSPGGVLTGLPAEAILAIQSGASQSGSAQLSARPQAADAVVRGRMTAIQTLAQPLQPGDILVLGPTGSGSAQVAAPNSGAAGATAPGVNSGYGNANGAYATNTPMYGGNAVPPGFAANGQPFVPAPGDLARAPSAGGPPTFGPNGFPLTGNATTVSISPNGTPLVAPAGSAGAAQPVIGPNGTPVLAQPGMPGSSQPAIGPNGTPVLAPPGAPGSTQPAIAPNGTPATGQPGTPSSAQPNTAPNGTPASPPPGASPKG